MTRTEAYKLLFILPKSECFVSQDVIKHEGLGCLDELPNFDYDELLKYFEELDLPYDFVSRFVVGGLEGYASLDNKNYGDDYDYLELWRREDGKLDLGVWTEVCGNMYFLSGYGKTWKEYTLSEEEIKAREEHLAKWSQTVNEMFSSAFEKIESIKVSGLGEYAPVKLLPPDEVKVAPLNKKKK